MNVAVPGEASQMYFSFYYQSRRTDGNFFFFHAKWRIDSASRLFRLSNNQRQLIFPLFLW